MTDAKVGQEAAARNGIAGRGVNPWLDWAARAAIVIVYGGFALMGAASVPRLLPLDTVHEWLMGGVRLVILP